MTQHFRRSSRRARHARDRIPAPVPLLALVRGDRPDFPQTNFLTRSVLPPAHDANLVKAYTCSRYTFAPRAATWAGGSGATDVRLGRVMPACLRDRIEAAQPSHFFNRANLPEELQ